MHIEKRNQKLVSAHARTILNHVTFRHFHVCKQNLHLELQEDLTSTATTAAATTTTYTSVSFEGSVRMPILFAVIARGTTVLAKYASCAGNFTEVTEQILQKIPQENSKLTYSHGSYLFHYVAEEKIVYMCITDDEFERAKAFVFLNDIKRRFQSQYGVRAQTALPYAMNSDFSRTMASQMRASSEDRPDQITKVQDQVEELKTIVVRNIDHLAERGEKLELLVDKTEDLSANSVTFKKTSRNLARSLWWKNIKLMIILAIVIIIVLYFIVSAACGGLDWPCTRK